MKLSRLIIQNQETFIKRRYATDFFIMPSTEYCRQYSTEDLFMIHILAGLGKEHTERLSGSNIFRGRYQRTTDEHVGH
jgi:hypothetical protein